MRRLREAVVERLKQAFAGEELEQEEFERRLTLAMNATNAEALLALTRDLPGKLGAEEEWQTIDPRPVPKPRAPTRPVSWLAVFGWLFMGWCFYCLARGLAHVFLT